MGGGGVGRRPGGRHETCRSWAWVCGGRRGGQEGGKRRESEGPSRGEHPRPPSPPSSSSSCSTSHGSPASAAACRETAQPHTSHPHTSHIHPILPITHPHTSHLHTPTHHSHTSHSDIINETQFAGNKNTTLEWKEPSRYSVSLPTHRHSYWYIRLFSNNTL